VKSKLIVLFLLALLMTTSSIGFARGSDASIEKPPSGIVPSTVTLGQVLKAHDLAVGRLTKVGDSERIEFWHFTKAGASGSERLVRHGTDYRSTIQTGPLTEEYGQAGTLRWHMNENGVVSDTTGTELYSFEMYRILDDASDPKNDVKLLGETQAPIPAYVVEVTIPAFKHPEWVFFDKKTSLIIRTERIFGEHRFVSTYDDYGTVEGLTEPAHIHDSMGSSELDDDYQRQSLTFSSNVKSSDFDKPASRVSYMKIDQPMSLNARVVRGTVVVRLTVNNRGLDFELSSGDSHSYIDWDVARELNLPTFGHVTQSGGKTVSYESEIADATSGNLHLQNFAVEVLPFSYHADFDTKVVGTLGYDFLSQGFFTVDYVNRRVSVSPNTESAADASALDVIPVWFDDGRPFFTTTIASHETRNVLLDSSFDFSMILGSFSQAYPEAVADARFGKRHEHMIVPFADRASYGVAFDMWLANVSRMQVGPMNFLDYKILATNVDMEQGDHPIDAVMGAQFLIYFDVSYDFAHERVLLKRNDYFKHYFRVTHT
jgi:hypothetical protein